MNAPDPTARNANIVDSIFADLRHQILAGALAAGSRLPGERELAAHYKTNRNTLREAVRKLEQQRLVSVRHGQGVTVSDFRRTGTLELLTPFLATGPSLGEVATMVEDVLAPRIIILEHTVRLAAERASRDDAERLRSIAQLLVAAFDAGNVQIIAKGFERWLDTLIDSTHSTSVRWVVNPFLHALAELVEKFPQLWIRDPGFPAHLLEVSVAISDGDAERACTSTRGYYERVDAQLVEVLRSFASAQLP